LNEDSRRLLALSIYHCVNDGSLTLFASALPVMRIGLGLSFLEIGTVLTAGLVSTMVLQLAFGVLSDRGHARRVLVLGFASIVAADLMFPISATFFQVLVFYVFLRSAAGVYHPVSFASIGRTFEDRTAAFGYQGAIGDLGLTFATFSTGLLSEAFSWRTPFWVWGGLGLVLFVYFIVTVSKSPVNFYARPSPRSRETSNDTRDVRSERSTFAILALTSSLTTVSFIIFTGYMPLYFNLIEGLSPSWSTGIVAFWIGIGAFAGLMTGRVVSGLGGEPKTLRVMFGIETILFLIANVCVSIPVAYLSESILREVAIALTGIPVFITFPAVNGLLGLRMSHRRLGLTYALNLSIGLMIASAATFATGYLASVASISVTLPILLVVAVLGTVTSFKL